jgi:hypothetical protein
MTEKIQKCIVCGELARNYLLCEKHHKKYIDKTIIIKRIGSYKSPSFTTQTQYEVL